MATDDPSKLKEGEIPLDISQLRPGVHVRLPVSWMEHQFAFSSFVIKDEEQIRQIAALNLSTLMCDLSRCKVSPLDKADAVSPPVIDDTEKLRLQALKAQQLAEKMDRAKVVTGIQKRLDTTQKHYIDATKSVSNAFKSFGMDPEESARQIVEVGKQSAKSILADVDSAIMLITEKGQNDGASAHALSVMTLSLLLGKQALLPEEALGTLAAGALLHDLGKATINPSILRNPERNKHEEALYQTHCRLGVESAAKAGPYLSKVVLDIILHHHERFDATGFPDKLIGEKIHVASRIVAIANRFDNLSNPIDYRRAMSPSEALSRMWVKEKQAFDPKLLQLFIRAMGVYPPGSIVQLTDGRVGSVVMSAKGEKLLSPQVMIYDPDIPRQYAVILDLAEDESVKIDHALRLRDRSEDELDYLLPRRKLNWFHAANK